MEHIVDVFLYMSTLYEPYHKKIETFVDFWSFSNTIMGDNIWYDELVLNLKNNLSNAVIFFLSLCIIFDLYVC